MAKDFTRSSNLGQQPPPLVQVKATANGTSQTQTPPPRRSWHPQNSSPPQQVDREAEIVEALKNPEFVQTITQVLKDRKEAARSTRKNLCATRRARFNLAIWRRTTNS